MTNKEIAGSLHYSVKTVEVYLTRIYAKTSTASRVELARAVDRGTLALG
jgi:DNA-binding NarL/FixJ family response regulator